MPPPRGAAGGSKPRPASFGQGSNVTAGHCRNSDGGRWKPARRRRCRRHEDSRVARGNRTPTPSQNRAWRKLHIDIDADSGEIVAFDLTDKDIDDASHVEALLDQLSDNPDSFIADGAYDRSSVLDAVLVRNPHAKFIVPTCKGAVPGPTAETSPTPRHRRYIEITRRRSPRDRSRNCGQIAQSTERSRASHLLRFRVIDLAPPPMCASQSPCNKIAAGGNIVSRRAGGVRLD